MQFGGFAPLPGVWGSYVEALLGPRPGHPLPFGTCLRWVPSCLCLTVRRRPAGCLYVSDTGRDSALRGKCLGHVSSHWGTRWQMIRCISSVYQLTPQTATVMLWWRWGKTLHDHYMIWSGGMWKIGLYLINFPYLYYVPTHSIHVLVEHFENI